MLLASPSHVLNFFSECLVYFLALTKTWLHLERHLFAWGSLKDGWLFFDTPQHTSLNVSSLLFKAAYRLSSISANSLNILAA